MNENYITFDLNNEVAQKWLEQANHILKIIEENIKRMMAEGKF